jgi:hypothetical protein
MAEQMNNWKGPKSSTFSTTEPNRIRHVRLSGPTDVVPISPDFSGTRFSYYVRSRIPRENGLQAASSSRNLPTNSAEEAALLANAAEFDQAIPNVAANTRQHATFPQCRGDESAETKVCRSLVGNRAVAVSTASGSARPAGLRSKSDAGPTCRKMRRPASFPVVASLAQAVTRQPLRLHFDSFRFASCEPPKRRNWRFFPKKSAFLAK